MRISKCHEDSHEKITKKCVHYINTLSTSVADSYVRAVKHLNIHSKSKIILLKVEKH